MQIQTTNKSKPTRVVQFAAEQYCVQKRTYTSTHVESDYFHVVDALKNQPITYHKKATTLLGLNDKVEDSYIAEDMDNIENTLGALLDSPFHDEPSFLEFEQAAFNTNLQVNNLNQYFTVCLENIGNQLNIVKTNVAQKMVAQGIEVDIFQNYFSCVISNDSWYGSESGLSLRLESSNELQEINVSILKADKSHRSIICDYLSVIDRNGQSCLAVQLGYGCEISEIFEDVEDKWLGIYCELGVKAANEDKNAINTMTELLEKNHAELIEHATDWYGDEALFEIGAFASKEIEKRKISAHLPEDNFLTLPLAQQISLIRSKISDLTVNDDTGVIQQITKGLVVIEQLVVDKCFHSVDNKFNGSDTPLFTALCVTLSNSEYEESIFEDCVNNNMEVGETPAISLDVSQKDLLPYLQNVIVSTSLLISLSDSL